MAEVMDSGESRAVLEAGAERVSDGRRSGGFFYLPFVNSVQFLVVQALEKPAPPMSAPFALLDLVQGVENEGVEYTELTTKDFDESVLYSWINRMRRTDDSVRLTVRKRRDCCDRTSLRSCFVLHRRARRSNFSVPSTVRFGHCTLKSHCSSVCTRQIGHGKKLCGPRMPATRHLTVVISLRMRSGEAVTHISS